jgi:hypothetical protein
MTYKNQKIKVFDAFQNIPKPITVLSSFINKFGIEIKDFSKCVHPREDFHKISKKYPIFVVSDGVTLELDKEGNYPKSSGAGKVAKIFCEAIIKEAEKKYGNFTVPDLKKIFCVANSKVSEYNKASNRIKSKLNYWDLDLFAATASLAVIKDKIVYWASICDSFVFHFKKDGTIGFKNPDCWDILRKNLPKNWLEIPEAERKRIVRKIYRNGINKNGRPIGYGVITGEKEAEKYLFFGKLAVEEGDVIMIFTDGFENYIKIKHFIELFLKWPKNIESKFKRITKQKSIENPNDFGRERTIIAVKV